MDQNSQHESTALAIELEEAGADWPTLEAIYQSALQDDPNNIDTVQSRGISAYRIGLRENDPALLDLAAEAFSAAAFLDPERSSSHYLMGVVAVERNEPADQALQHFETAIDLDPNNGWALLRKAQCLHDLHQWDDAVDAYLKVPKATFQHKNSAWRINYLVEEIAYCRLQAGDIEGSRTGFETILDRYEKQPHLLDDAVDTFLPTAAEAFPDMTTRITHILQTRPQG